VAAKLSLDTDLANCTETAMFYDRVLCALHLPSQEVETLAEVAWRVNSLINARLCPTIQLH